RVLYVPGGIRIVGGKMTLPLRVLAQATGAGLSWNATVSTVKLNTDGAKAPTASYNEEDLYWLARVISAESGGESLLGQIAVGNVVLNRVKSDVFPNTIKDVVFDTKDGVQFEPTSIGTIYDPPTDSSVLAAKMCLEGADVVGDCMYFFAPALSKGTWIVKNCTYYMTIGCHQFYW
ncbi:MAG: cell wall hydrolase, partial [Lawsonibacter sp.]|nr:cell wall hydrolase [Lawsonibacter sp.]